MIRKFSTKNSNEQINIDAYEICSLIGKIKVVKFQENIRTLNELSNKNAL